MRSLSWFLASFLVALTAVVASAGSSWSSEKVESTVLHVWKARRELWLVNNGEVQRRFDIALGKEPDSKKLRRGDGRTPEGRYFICSKKPQSRFRRFLGISYPNVGDAEKAYRDKLISGDEWADILFSTLHQTTPPWSTALGGWVGIHGYGDREEIQVNWTEGCIAVSNDGIDYLYDRVAIGTPIIIAD